MSVKCSSLWKFMSSQAQLLIFLKYYSFLESSVLAETVLQCACAVESGLITNCIGAVVMINLMFSINNSVQKWHWFRLNWLDVNMTLSIVYFWLFVMLTSSQGTQIVVFHKKHNLLFSKYLKYIENIRDTSSCNMTGLHGLWPSSFHPTTHRLVFDCFFLVSYARGDERLMPHTLEIIVVILT